MSASERRFSVPRAHLSDKAVVGVELVELWGFAEWIKSRPLVFAHLTAREARRLAVELLTAAEALDEREVSG